jgi:short-subunit dehydrogenase
LPTFIKKNKGLIVGFGSVSAIIGREKNAVYASSKRALESFFESLIIKTIATNLKIQFYVVGYLNTNLSYGKKLFLPKGSPNKLAKIVYKNLNQNYYKKYFPFWWIYIAFILKILPFFIIKNIYSLFLKKNEK